MATTFTVQCFQRKGSKLVADPPKSARSGDAAVELAERLATLKAGVVAFSQEIDVDTDSYDDAAICSAPFAGLDAVVAERAGEFADPVPVSTLLEPIGEEGFRSVARLVFKGVLAPVEPQARIGWGSLVSKAA